MGRERYPPSGVWPVSNAYFRLWSGRMSRRPGPRSRKKATDPSAMPLSDEHCICFIVVRLCGPVARSTEMIAAASRRVLVYMRASDNLLSMVHIFWKSVEQLGVRLIRLGDQHPTATWVIQPPESFDAYPRRSASTGIDSCVGNVTHWRPVQGEAERKR